MRTAGPAQDGGARFQRTLNELVRRARLRRERSALLLEFPAAPVSRDVVSRGVGTFEADQFDHRD
jgi:hypothetical protein